MSNKYKDHMNRVAQLTRDYIEHGKPVMKEGCVEMSEDKIYSKPSTINDDLEAQCCICPKCHDDHYSDGPCTPRDDSMFMPAKEDHSYIANEYRKRVEQLAQSKAVNAKLRMALEKYANVENYTGLAFIHINEWAESATALAREALSSDPIGQDLLDAIHFVLHELGVAETAKEIGVAKTFIRSALAALKKAMGDV